MKKYYVHAVLIGLLVCLPIGAEELLTAETYASYYGEAFNGKPTSSGEIFDMNAYTAAHKTLPFGTILEVTNLENGKRVVVRVNDRGPFIANREIDLSKAAAESLGMVSKGITRVSIKKVDSLEYAALVAANDTYSKTNAVPAQTNQIQPDTQREEAPIQNESEQHVQAQAQPEQTAVSDNQAEKREAVQKKETEQPQPTAASTSAAPVEKVYEPTDAQQTAGILWRIQLGSFTREENALRLVVSLRKAGFDPAYERTDSSVRVVLPGIRPSDLDKVKKVLSEHSFTDYIIRQESW